MTNAALMTYGLWKAFKVRIVIEYCKGDAMVEVALWVRLEAKPGKEKAVADFLKSGLALVQQEPSTTAWFAVQIGPSIFGIFDAFTNEDG